MTWSVNVKTLVCKCNWFTFTQLYITSKMTILHLHAKYWFWDFEHVGKNEVNLMQTSVACAVGPSVTTSSTRFSF
jgi:hypothetical protein